MKLTIEDVNFHIDMGCSNYVLIKRLLEDPDCEATKEQINEFINQMIKNNLIYVHSSSENDRFLKR